jgi:GNAT superfamily N-acetyltransferase
MPDAILSYKVDAPITAKQVADLRESVGWDRREEQHERILNNTWRRVTCHDDTRLVGYVDVISDGVDDAFVRDLIVHPGYQGRGIGTQLLHTVLRETIDAGIACVGALFSEDLAPFYRRAGFRVVAGGLFSQQYGDTIPEEDDHAE